MVRGWFTRVTVLPDGQEAFMMMMWLTPLKPSAVRLLGRPPPLGVRDFLDAAGLQGGVLAVTGWGQGVLIDPHRPCQLLVPHQPCQLSSEWLVAV
ncbi:hypothetical protein HaLaN_21562 [Haematococcus lacustris]|uniref:Uncharacterized protein n=1 Tax=Haematococcus lacustris TaxID=44745 RepID=A0A699ZNT5_HAELA|nr:hypothetical protein HaLaN_21562 [Haematococcus lacustris]